MTIIDQIVINPVKIAEGPKMMAERGPPIMIETIPSKHTILNFFNSSTLNPVNFFISGNSLVASGSV